MTMKNVITKNEVFNFLFCSGQSKSDVDFYHFIKYTRISREAEMDALCFIFLAIYNES